MEHITKFNGLLRGLVADLANRNPGDAVIDRARLRVQTVIRYDPAAVIGLVGPYLFRYHEKIYALADLAAPDAEGFFLDNSYAEELAQGKDAEKIDMVEYIIPRAKQSYRTLGEEDRKQYRATVIALLDTYLDYMAPE